MSVQTCFLPGQRSKSHRRLYFQQLAVKKATKMFSQHHFPSYFTPATFCLFLKVKSELASCLLTQGSLKKSL
jgi:hypothetical protein